MKMCIGRFSRNLTTYPHIMYVLSLQVKARLEQQNMNSVNTMNPPQTQ